MDHRQDVLVEVGDSTLTINDVMAKIPSGLSSEDSTELFNSIVNRWIRNMVLSDVAQKNVYDLEKIERMVEDYRNDLIITQYLKSMSEVSGEISEKSIRSYFGDHGDSMKLSAPIVKGIYLKVPDDDEHLDDFRRWMKNPVGIWIDNIEKYGLKNASQYEYFMEKWINWEEISEKIPYRFFDADAFLQSTNDFETSYAGSTYLLHISEYVPSGEKMPYDYAERDIARILEKNFRDKSKKKLINDIYKEKISEGRLRGFLYDPLKGELKDTTRVSQPSKK